MTDVENFYNRIKELCKLNCVTIESVAKIANLNLNQYNSIKRGGNMLRSDQAVRIAKALNTTVEYLVTGTEPPPKIALPDDLQAIIKKYAK